MVKIEFKKGTAFDTDLEARIDAMKESKEKKCYVLLSAKNGLT